ncbi:hypothetical protein B0A58_09040 [Flavobacterium branchiophilum NBRC 15030 = ATCC 35035]|uniref:Uncharacterized protein n=1 Tax=Flavobacterium branchiophilum TaxID=55197 RepID=A0A543G5R9_9FLAO|nr:hypothetical protein [Flavobacterium branchiophilum]OXA75316.1 hypothetical protein B0A58_09040 [Flavobacterium branchiophilum NBRC 15030 = ATCC 35035]TQM41421.1 hypothetical protein BC670_2383 [Flavobacterium branchiophilum]GEM55905.1 hypothetical protein FB1_21260 [Flavobacterium branchiophilum NBRC 15030 = ATCC 35035]
MKELDLLKRDWQKTEHTFESISDKDIYKMIHQKSYSTVRWILIFSIVEFVVFNGIGLLLDSENIEKIIAHYPFLGYLDKLNYIVIIGFIVLFYLNYRSISVLNSSKNLIKHILKTRKIVRFYIIWNMVIGCLFGIYGILESFESMYQSNQSHMALPSIAAQIITSIIILGLLIGFLFLFYKLVYGRLLNKLKKNYDELSKME